MQQLDLVPMVSGENRVFCTGRYGLHWIRLGLVDMIYTCVTKFAAMQDERCLKACQCHIFTLDSFSLLELHTESTVQSICQPLESLSIASFDFKSQDSFFNFLPANH